MPPLSMSARDASEDITEDKNGGVRKILVTKGNGLKPLFGDKVYIRYVGFLENGNPFTSNRNHGDNLFTFTIGKGAWSVIGCIYVKKIYARIIFKNNLKFS